MVTSSLAIVCLASLLQKGSITKKKGCKKEGRTMCGQMDVLNLKVVGSSFEAA